MAEGHIKLGATAATLRDYLLVEPRQYRATSANPMAARVSTGSQYGDLQAWSTFLMADWQAGAGRTQADAGGYLFGEIESRVPNQLILPAALGCASMQGMTPSHFYMPATASAYIAQSVGGTGNPTRVAWITSAPAEGATKPATIYGVAFYGYVPDGVEITAAVYSHSGGTNPAVGVPDTQLAIGTLTASTDRPGYQWYYVPLSEVYKPTPASGVTNLVHWVIYPTDDSNVMEVIGGPDSNSYQYDGEAWASRTGWRPFHLWNQPWLQSTTITNIAYGTMGFFSTNDKLYAISALYNTSTDAFVDAGGILVFASTTNSWSGTYGGAAWTIPDADRDDLGGPVLFDNSVYVPAGTASNKYDFYPGGGATSTNDAHLFCSWAGYLWRAYNNQLWYSTDGTTWTAITNDVGPSDYRIRGMAGFGQYLYVATDEALYYVAPGDVAVGLFPWSTIDKRNGAGMVVHQGALYIPVAGRILRYSEDGSLQDVWMNRDDDLNNRRLGKIAALAGLSNWLVAGVDGTTSSDPSSVWAFTQQGWHHLATLPPGFTIRALYYDRMNSRLWIATDNWAAFYIHAPDWALNPYNDSNSTYMPQGWMEIGRVYGGLRELRKDWESVRLFGEFTATGQDVTVYWQDAGTTTWTSLGTATEDAQELRWSDYSTRPSGRWLRLAFLLATDDPATTPKIEAVATKLLPMVTDREAWNLSILISDGQEMIDGDVNPYTASEMIAHLRGLVQQVPPFIFEDVDGTQYEVKAQGSARNIQQYEWLDASQEKRIMWVYEIAVEQVTSGTYN
jgi:hypothetical protein